MTTLLFSLGLEVHVFKCYYQKYRLLGNGVVLGVDVKAKISTCASLEGGLESALPLIFVCITSK